MKRMIIVVALTAITGCMREPSRAQSDQHDTGAISSSAWVQQFEKRHGRKLPQPTCTAEQFIALPTNATMPDVVALAGPPHADLASGIYHWVYRLKDDARADLVSGDGTTIGSLHVLTASGALVHVIGEPKKDEPNQKVNPIN